MNLPLRSLPVLLALLLGVGCRSSGGSGAGAGAPPRLERDYVFAFLVRGTPREPISPERAAELGQGHMANIRRLADERSLLVAGPFGDPRPDARLRGLFVFDTARLADARALVVTDPAIEAGSLAAELYSFRSATPLRELPELYAAFERERRAADPDAPAFEGRSYALVLAADGAAAERALAPLVAEGRVLYHGRLRPGSEGTERWTEGLVTGGLVGGALFCLDETDIEVARSRVEAAAAAAGEVLEWQVLHWWASSALTRLPARAVASTEAPPGPEALRIHGSIQAGIEHRR